MQVAILDAKKETIIDKVPASRPIIVQDLFRHTSGLIRGADGTTAVHKIYPDSSGVAARTMTSSKLLDQLSTLPLFFQPGTVWEYSFGLDVLGLIIESITKKSLGQYLQESLWSPLGMSDAAFTLSAEKAARYAHALPNDPITGRPQSVLSPTNTKFECGGGCALSTAGDYLRFAWVLGRSAGAVGGGVDGTHPWR
jgi:CubicO group peptidase (beta-lactamase class C family)